MIFESRCTNDHFGKISSYHCSMVSMATCYLEGHGFKFRHGRESLMLNRKELLIWIKLLHLDFLCVTCLGTSSNGNQLITRQMLGIPDPSLDWWISIYVFGILNINNKCHVMPPKLKNYYSINIIYQCPDFERLLYLVAELVNHQNFIFWKQISFVIHTKAKHVPLFNKTI